MNVRDERFIANMKEITEGITELVQDILDIESYGDKYNAISKVQGLLANLKVINRAYGETALENSMLKQEQGA